MIRTIGDWYNPVDDVTAVADAASSAFNAAIDAVPGARDVVNAVDSVVAGPVRDFARTAVGRTLLTALASTVTGGLAPVLGPQLATVAFALPGMAAGDDFVTAWTQEFGSRVNQLVQIYGDQAPELVNAELGKVYAYLQKQGIADPSQVFTMQQLASAAGVSDWTAAFVLDGARGALVDLKSHIFDPRTGATLDTSRVAIRSSSAFRAGALVTALQRGSEARTITTAAYRPDTASRVVAAAKPAPAPVRGASGASSTVPAKSGTKSNVALVVLGVAAVGALYWWSRK